MALGETNITTTLIRNAIGAASNAVGALCQHVNINRFSKKKPVRGAYPASANGKYGFDLVNNWDYLRPRGSAYSEPYRMGDFRGYEHDPSIAFPVIQARSSETIIPANLTPSGGTPTATWKVRVFNDTNAARVTPADLGLSSYYVGIRVTGAVGGPHYRTFVQVSAIPSTGVDIVIDASIADSSIPSYANCPYGEGNLTFTLVLLPLQIVGGWTTTTPSVVYTLPSLTFNGVTYTNNSVINIVGWLALDPDENWEGAQYQWGAYGQETITAKVYGTTSTEFNVASKPSWLTVKVYTGGGIEDTGGNPYPVEYEIRMYPASYNETSVQRTGNVVISNVNATITIPVSQNGIAGYTGVVTAGVASGETFTIEAFDASVNIAQQKLTFSFYTLNYSLYGGPMHYEIFVNNSLVETVEFMVEPDEVTNNREWVGTIATTDDIYIEFHSGNI